MKKLSIIAACLLTVGLLGGCGTKFDASAYTKALLDNSYKNDSTDFVSMKLGTAEEAADLYEQGLDAEVDAMLSAAGNVSDAQAQEFRQVFADILAGARYTVGEAEKQDDGSFVVTVTYEQMQVFGPAMEQYMDDINAWAAEIQSTGNIPSDDEMMEKIVDMLKDSLVGALPKATYADSATTTIRIELNNNEYSPNENDIYNLEMVLFDLEDAMNALQ